ncbi:prolyl aminopeptidase [uncultured Bartonella sp.]|uniref:prolyl aminopeptidase n=1 Tax=uncultured Bartonella sp. TaxID=104108 RepID=UPI0025F4C254|nr:prolyl aminopeptidase [uncultured Bartonella sp.]
MRELYPTIEPFEHGMLDVGDGHELYWERVGTKGAEPAVFLHGGPGSGISENHRRLFDPNRYDVLLFDQRGCGRSTPHASITANTTWHLVEDIEKLRQMAGIDKWLVFGGSWGSTLALAYAETHPDRVSGLVLRGIFTGSRDEFKWSNQYGASEISPDYWQDYIKPVPLAERNDLISAYHRLLNHEQKDIAINAARAWSEWEAENISIIPPKPSPRTPQSDQAALDIARLENHYFVNDCWLEEEQLFRNLDKIRHLPCVIIHGRHDIICRLSYAWKLHKSWPGSKLHIIEGAGHSYSEPGILDCLIKATDQFAEGRNFL